MPKFSIIVPCYNLERWIAQCLNSVMGQTFRDWECIVVDDESTDSSGRILDEYAEIDCRFKVIHQKNVGEGGARNSGLAIAKGEWVFFLDGDDLMWPNSLSSLVDCISENDNIIRFEFLVFDDGNVPELPPPNASLDARRIDVSRTIKMAEFFAYVWQHVYRRSAIGGIQFKKYKRGCDRLFLDDVLLNRVEEIKIVDLLCYGYRQRQGSAMDSVPSAQVLRDEMDHRLDIMEIIDASGKRVDYAGNQWLEKYFTRCMYGIIESRSADRDEVLSDWRSRLIRFRRLKGISLYGHFVAWSCSFVHLRLWDELVCHVIPSVVGRPFRFMKRVLVKIKWPKA